MNCIICPVSGQIPVIQVFMFGIYLVPISIYKFKNLRAAIVYVIASLFC